MSYELVTIGGIAALLALSLFLALIDVAFDYFSRFSIRTYEDEGWKNEFLTRALEDPMRLLLPLRIGLQGSFVALTMLVAGWLVSFDSSYPFAMTFGLVLLAYMVFRELVPNIIARKNPERVLLALLPAFRLYSVLVSPISRPLSRFVGAFVQQAEVSEEEASEEEVQAFIEAGEEEGILEGGEGRLVQSIVDFSDKIVREVMTPRPELVAVRSDVSLAQLREVFNEEKHSRMPVYRETLDQIQGLVHALDLLAFTEANPDASIRPLIRDVSFVPETKKLTELLTEFQHRGQTVSIVVDEYGGTSGIVTVEDLLEEIVGEIRDEFDEFDQDIVEEREGVFLVSGRADIDDVKEKLRLDVIGSGFETVSGFILDKIGRIPKVGETIDHDGLRLEVVDAEGHRINKIRFRRDEASTT